MDAPLKLAALCWPLALMALGACVETPRLLYLDGRSDETASFPEARTGPPPPTGPVPPEPQMDWVELTSGEWLRGALLRIRSGQLEFDSEALGNVSVSLDDVAALRTAADQALVTAENHSLRGRLVLRGDDLWIQGERTVALDREALFAALVLKDGEPVEWTGKVTLGATARSGNTSQNDFSGYVELLRESARRTWRTTYNGVASRAGGVETANNHRLRSVHDIYVSRRLFVTAPTVDAYRDRFQNIDLRVIAGAALGYQLVDSPAQHWKIGVGPAYQFTRFAAVGPGGDAEEGSLATVLRSELAWDATDRIELGLDYQLNVSLEDTSDYNHNLLARLSVDLIADLTLDLVFVWDRVNEPSANGDGSVPRPDDYRTTVGLGWAF